MVAPADTRRVASASEPAREVLAGLIERVTFHSPANGFCGLRIKARGHRELVTVVGHAAQINPGEWITVSGEWVNDREHGLQFKATFLRTSPPTSAEGMAKDLGSGMIRGIGPIYASKLIDAFGEEVFAVIEEMPERLREVAGIGKVRAGRIDRAWADQKVVGEIMVFLHSHGVGTADASAARLGIAPDAMIRLRARLNYAMLEASGECPPRSCCAWRGTCWRLAMRRATAIRSTRR